MCMSVHVSVWCVTLHVCVCMFVYVLVLYVSERASMCVCVCVCVQWNLSIMDTLGPGIFGLFRS